MKYYKRFPIETLYSIEEGESSRKWKVAPSTRGGNIIHEFCEYYRENSKPIELLRNIVASYGLEYDEELQMELMPYIENYLKFYREDYDLTYTEKDFYMKIEDTYIHGIIDRINIKKMGKQRYWILRPIELKIRLKLWNTINHNYSYMPMLLKI